MVGGYASYVALDTKAKTGIVILSNKAVDVTMLGMMLTRQARRQSWSSQRTLEHAVRESKSAAPHWLGAGYVDRYFALELFLSGFMLIAWLFIAGYVALLTLAWRHLRLVHPTVWEVLGRPSIYNINLGVVFPARKFLWSKQCQELNDQKLLSLSRWGKVFGYAGAGLFLAFALLMLGVVFNL